MLANVCNIYDQSHSYFNRMMKVIIRIHMKKSIETKICNNHMNSAIINDYRINP